MYIEPIALVFIYWTIIDSNGDEMELKTWIVDKTINGCVSKWLRKHPNSTFRVENVVIPKV